MKAYGYTRLSQESDRSIDSQKEDIHNYCQDHELELEKIFDDGQNSSGFNNKRKAYTEMKQALKNVDAVIVRDRARLGRDFDERMQFIIDLRQKGIQLHTTTEGQIDLEDPISVAVEGIHSASDDKKKREEIKKSQAEIQKRKKEGLPLGRPPFGLKYNDSKTDLVPDDNFDRVREVLEMRENGRSYPEIASHLNMPQSKVYRVVQRKQMYQERISQ